MGHDALIDRFWAKVQKTDTCWLWNACKNSDGYGRFNVNGRLTQAHRFSYELVHGPIESNKIHVLHTCDTPNCVNPGHLFTGTHSDNMRDMYRKFRHGNGKLPTCHPDRPYQSKDMCRQCYLKAWHRANPTKMKEYNEKHRSLPQL
jgi:hypothetical protein